MEHRISATDLVRRLGDVLGRIRYRGEWFTVERNGTPVARIGPVPGASPCSVRDALAAWRASSPPEPTLADLLERTGKADRPPENPWDS